ncbi:MAG: DUF3473 domain-containing protein [Desulfobacteraceae bacterium]|nr:DUF3473 domain-containing protein [Desulfobacteraceae bacterium]
MQNYLTIDVEDYFHVAAFSDIVSSGQWSGMESRVTANLRTILSLLKKHDVRATFFVLGWIADKYPQLVLDIMADGHDIGCHSYWHRKIYELTPAEFRADTLKAKSLLEKICNREITAYRAPSYSITAQSLWALDILAETGFTTDSSIFPIRHDVYGIPDAPRFPYKFNDREMTEFPISTAVFFGRKIPVSGGGYFRIFPYWFTKLALKRINNKEMQPFVFYLHPWEIDHTQPRFRQARLRSKLRHYINLDKTMQRFERLLNDFRLGPLPASRVATISGI